MKDFLNLSGEAATLTKPLAGAVGDGHAASASADLTEIFGSAEKVLDFLAVFGTVYAANALQRSLEPLRRASYGPANFLFCAAGFALLFVFLLERQGGYRGCVSLLAIRETERVLRVTLQSFALALVTAYLCALPVSRLAFSLAVVLTPCFLTLEKWEMHRVARACRRKGHGTRRAVIVGSGPIAKRIYSALLRSPNFGVEPVAIVDETAWRSRSKVYESSYRRRRPARILAGPLCPELFRQLNACVLVIAASGTDRASTALRAASAAPAGVDAYFVPGDFLEDGCWIDYAELDGMMLAHVARGRRRVVYDVGKRGLDLVVAAAALALSSPLLAVIALLVKSSSKGPVLFRQVRVGRNGQLFTMYKFRTMYRDVPTYGYSPTAGEDPRVTRIGRWLRHSSLDEFPQLINVLLGQMSVVGPRPEMPFIVEKYTALQRERLTVKPGITCLWQLSADRAFLIHENMEYDLYYVRHRSLFMDVAILLHTFLFAARGV